MDRILVPMDDSEMAERALEYAFEAFPDAEIVVFHVVGEPSVMMGEAVSLALEDDIEQAGRDRAETLLERARDLAAEYDIDIETEVGYGRPAKAIINRAEDFDTLVMGTHGGSLIDRLLVGNVAETVFRHSPIPVTSVR